MEAFERLMSFFMTPKCYEEIFFKFNLTNVDCLKMIISKGLGYGILAGSLLLRVPQIIKIVSAGSGKGISLFSEILSMIAIFGAMSYGYYNKYPIAAYGDTFFLYLQSIIIFLLILFYDKNFLIILLSFPVFSSISYMVYANMLHKEIIFTLNGLSVFLNVISRLYQAFLNYRNGSTGALSAITLVLQFLGCVARIFTSIQETGDYNLIMSFVIASAANGVLVLQLFYYWNSDKKAVKAQKKKN